MYIKLCVLLEVADPRTNIRRYITRKINQRKITTEAAHGYSSYGNQIGLATGQVAEVYDEGFVAKENGNWGSNSCSTKRKCSKR